jgi:dienelactone hydrolase
MPDAGQDHSEVYMLVICVLVSFAAPLRVPTQFEMPLRADSPVSAQLWQKQIRARLFEIVEKQNPRRQHPLGMSEEETPSNLPYRTVTLRFASNENPDGPVECLLTLPRGQGPFPAVVCLHGHGGSANHVHDPADETYHGFAAEFARRGFVTLAPTFPHFEYAPNNLWNLLRLVDALEARPEVDAARIGCVGLSMGGEWTMWLTVCDQRINAAVVSGWMCTTEGVLRVPNCPCWCPPGLLDLCDIAEVHILVAPRPLLFESATEDNCFPIDATREGFKKILRGYAALGAPENVQQHLFPGGHAWNGAVAYDFMERALKRRMEPKGNGAP